MKHSSIFTRWTSGWGKRLAIVTVFGLFLSAGVFTAHAMPGNTPVFNGIVTNCGTNCDYPTLQVGKPGVNWATSINAAVGDHLTLWVWDHNNAVDDPSDPTNYMSIAQNVHIKATVSTEQGNTHTVTASVSADNAATVTGTATINVAADSTIAFMPGTAQVYRRTSATSPLEPVSWDNPDAVVTNPTGLAMGEQKGCWQFAQAVLFQVQVVAIQTGTPKITTEKLVQVAGASTSYAKTVTARPGDMLDFRVQVDNQGTAPGVEPTVRDDLDSHLSMRGTTAADQEYWPTLVYKQDNVDHTGKIDPDHFLHNGQHIGFAFGDMQPGPQNTIFISFEVMVAGPDQFPDGTTPIQNCETASFTGGYSAQSCVTINVVKTPTPVYSFTLTKEVKNLTNHENEWHTSTAAKPGDQVAYRVVLVNTGNTPANNVVLKDALPSDITYAGQATETNGSGTINNQPIDASGFFNGGGFAINTIPNGSANDLIFIYTANVGGTCSTGAVSNNVTAAFNNQQVAQAHAQVTISCTQGLIIQKTILDPTTNQYVHRLDQVHENQYVWYQIVVTNNGNVPARHVILKDVLPSLLQFVPGSMKIDGAPEGSNETFLFDQTNGLLLSDLMPGVPKTLLYEVHVPACPPAGNITLTNVSTVKADGVAPIGDAVTTTLHVNVPAAIVLHN